MIISDKDLKILLINKKHEHPDKINVPNKNKVLELTVIIFDLIMTIAINNDVIVATVKSAFVLHGFCGMKNEEELWCNFGTTVFLHSKVFFREYFRIACNCQLSLRFLYKKFIPY
ncbi:MAG: hypothetical protein COT84_00140 [Chlamydiae bacterium CG10_big_fil_rev_8_21_14_0_10_35_9]|nr:MAG: hypothetical protein COT84_00140 [Chlamydiae bacterium CG10_big_fil_rev_8_21_14_0_10_35_9]